LLLYKFCLVSSRVAKEKSLTQGKAAIKIMLEINIENSA
jgi:hypothetical protein